MPIGSEITQLLLRQGDIAAQQAQQSGQITGAAFHNIGQDVSGAITQATDPKRLEFQRQQQGRAALAARLKSTPPTADGTPDYKSVANGVSTDGFPELGEAYLSSASNNEENLQKLSNLKATAAKAARDYQLHQLETVGDAAFHADTPEKFTASVGLLAAHGQLDEKSAQGILAQADQGGPDGWKAIRDQFLQHSPLFLKQQEELNKPMAVPEGGSIRNAAGTLNVQGTPKPPTEAELALQASGGNPVEAMDRLKPKPVESAQSVDKLLDGKPATLMFDPKTKQYTDASGKVIDNAATRIKPIPSAASVAINAGALSDAAMEQAARKYLETGQLPPGFGTAGTVQKTAIMNYAAKLDPTAALARNQATFKADSANLTSLTKTEGTLSAFEKTAGKNLDQFLSLADKIPDTGVPWINAPIRSINAQGLGSADQAAFNAARDVALREIARVTNDPKLSGALTDSARREVSGLSASNATFAQIKAVAKVLKQDMANVHSGLNEQIASVKNSMGQNPNAPSGDVRQKAATILSGAGKASDAAAVDAFLKNNPSFK